jgi:hypothetical protein
MPQLSGLSLEGLRQCVRPEFAAMAAEDLEQIVDSSISGVPHDAAEDFMDRLGSLGRAVAPTVQRAAPGIAQGAITGASVGGPWGALIGAGAGLASSAASTGKPAPATAPAPTVNLSPSATTPSATPAAAALPTGQAAAATLVSLLQNPIVQQALMSQVLGGYGRQQVPTASGTDLPRGAINNVLTQLVANASEALPESESISEQTYLQGESGEYLIDPAAPEQQAALVLSHLQSARAARLQSDAGEYLEVAEWLREGPADSEAEEWLESEESTEMARFY